MEEYDYLQKSQDMSALKISTRVQQEKWFAVLPCMDMEGATDATGIGGMETPPKEL